MGETGNTEKEKSDGNGEQRDMRALRRAVKQRPEGPGRYPFRLFDNPVLRRELLTGLRENRAFVFQFLFLLVLSATIWAAWPETYISTQSARARELFKIFGIGQLVLLAMLTPAFSAGALTMEKERYTLDLLMTAPLPPRDIFLGKYLSAVSYLTLLILSTAPLAVVCLWLGGIGADAVTGMYFFLLSAGAAYGMVGLTCSTYFDRTQVALTVSYLAILPPTAVLLLFAWTPDFFAFSSVVWPAAMLLSAAGIMYRAALMRLRKPFDPVTGGLDEEKADEQTGLVLMRHRFPDKILIPERLETFLPDGAGAVHHKERRCDLFGRGTIFLRLVLQLGLFLSVAAMTALFLRRESWYVSYLVIFSVIVAPALACNVFTQERERGTLDLLLTTPLTSAQIVTGKLIARGRLALSLSLVVGLVLLFYPLVGAGPFERRMVALFLYLAVLGATLFFETALAFFCSLVFPSTLQSMVATYGVLLLVFALPSAARQLLLLFGRNPTPEQIAWTGFTSPMTAITSIAAAAGVDGHGNFFAPGSVWPAYLAFALVVGGILLAAVYLGFSRWCVSGMGRAPRPRL